VLIAGREKEREERERRRGKREMTG